MASSFSDTAYSLDAVAHRTDWHANACWRITGDSIVVIDPSDMRAVRLFAPISKSQAVGGLIDSLYGTRAVAAE